ncbi:hypothetical protein [Streptomyces sp. NPDC093589]|uniref:hypothetical protein n=1 Tax=Streptomyces sp. NPDC093589 TaxID=3366043 RepID=UPI00382CDF89
MTAHQQARLARLLAHLKANGGPATTGRIHRLYRTHGIPGRTTARGDLEAATTAGLLTAHGPTNHRTYTLREPA